jgi:uncharacterized protein
MFTKHYKSSKVSQKAVTLDTNVLISALVFGGNPRKVLDLCIKGDFVLVMSEEIYTELHRKVNQKFPQFLEDLEKFEVLLRQDAILVRLGDITVDTCRDPDDNRVLETAILGGCVFIVSGDKDLLELKQIFSTHIVSPVEFLDLL